MVDRKLNVQPRHRPDVSGFDTAPPEDEPIPKPAPRRSPAPKPPAELSAPKPRPKAGSRRAARAGGSDARKRVHVTLDRRVADAVAERVRASGVSNTQVLIEAYEAVGTKVRAATTNSSSVFGPRRSPGGGTARRAGVYFYLSSSELDHLSEEAARLGFETRSAHLDAILAKHLL